MRSGNSLKKKHINYDENKQNNKKKDYNPDFLPTKSLSKDLYYLLLSF